MRSEKAKSCISYEIESATAGANLSVPFQDMLRPEESQEVRKRGEELDRE